jgi:hypothetical protein
VKPQNLRAGAHERGEIVEHHLDELLTGRDTLQHFLAQRLYLNLGNEFFYNAVINIGLKQRPFDFAQGLGDVFLR